MIRYRYIFLLSALLLVPALLCAQPFDRVYRRNFWNDGRNVAGLRADSLSISYAELSGTYRSGGFRDSWQESEGWSAGAVAKTITHLKQFSMEGAFSFMQTMGSEMCGSMFISPGFYPFDILEFTPGRKSLQTYSFSGGISVDVSENWRVGAKMDFSAANYSKRKDLRHTNYRLDMTVVPGVMFHRGDWAVGLAYVYGKNSEKVDAEQIGTAESSYYAFLDKGMMYGDYEIWTGSRVHLSEAGISGFPVKESMHGVAVSGQWKRLFAEVEYDYTYGTAGEKQSEWYNFPGQGVSAGIKAAFAGKKTEHFARIGFEWKGRENYENVLDKVTTGGVTTTVGYGSNLIYKENKFVMSPEYEAVSQKWELRAGMDAVFTEKSVSQLYPYAFLQKTFVFSAGARALVHLRRFDVGLSAGFGGGSMKEQERIVDEQVEVNAEPFRLEEYYLLQKEYLTASRILAGLSLRYNFLKGMYLEASVDYVHGFALKYLPGPDRWTASMKIGYTF